MTDDTTKENHDLRHDHATVERIETFSGNRLPWAVRLAFGVFGLLLLSGAFVAWRFGSELGSEIAPSLPWLMAAAVILGVGAIVESITVEIWLAIIIGLFAVLVSFIIVGRVLAYPSSGQSIFVVDRFAGQVELCTPESCKVLPRSGIIFTDPLPHKAALPAKP